VAFRAPRLGDIFDGEKDQARLAVRLEHTASIEAHRPRSDRRELVLDLEVLDDAVPRQDLHQQRPKLRDVPLAVPGVEQALALRVPGYHLEGLVERPVGRHHA
jgi:hypothetical protein